VCEFWAIRRQSWGFRRAETAIDAASIAVLPERKAILAATEAQSAATTTLRSGRRTTSKILVPLVSNLPTVGFEHAAMALDIAARPCTRRACCSSKATLLPGYCCARVNTFLSYDVRLRCTRGQSTGNWATSANGSLGGRFSLTLSTRWPTRTSLHKLVLVRTFGVR